MSFRGQLETFTRARPAQRVIRRSDIRFIERQGRGDLPAFLFILDHICLRNVRVYPEDARISRLRESTFDRIEWIPFDPAFVIGRRGIGAHAFIGKGASIFACDALRACRAGMPISLGLAFMFGRFMELYFEESRGLAGKRATTLGQEAVRRRAFSRFRKRLIQERELFTLLLDELGRLNRGKRVRIPRLTAKLVPFGLRGARRSGEFDYPRMLLSISVTCGLRSGAQDVANVGQFLQAASESRSMPELLRRMSQTDVIGTRS